MLNHATCRKVQVASRRWLALSIQMALLGAPWALHAQQTDSSANAQTPDKSKTGGASVGQSASSNVVNLNTIVVNAQKREQQVLEVPASITALSGDFLHRYGITTLDDLGRYVPGVQVQVQSPNTPSLSIRGITIDDTAANTPSRVSVFQDGVDISSQSGSIVALYDMADVEVMRGPQGTLFGRAAESGAFALNSNIANDTTSGGFTAQAGNYDSHLLTGFFNTPISSNVDARIAVYDNEHEGYIPNTEGGRLDGADTKAVRASLHIKFNGNSYYDIIANYERDAPPGTDFRSALPNVYGSTNIYGAASLYGGNELGVRRKISGLTGIGNFVINDDWTLSSTTGLRRYDSDENFNASGTQAPVLQFGNSQGEHQISQELRLNYDSGGRFSGFFGANFFYNNGHQTVPFNTNESSLLAAITPLVKQLAEGLDGGKYLGLVDSVFGNPPLLNSNYQPNLSETTFPLLGTPLNPNESEGYANRGSSRSFEFFADGTFRVTDKFDITAGLRATHEQIWAGYQVFNATGSSAAVIGPGFAKLGELLGIGPLGLDGVTAPNDIFAPTNGLLTNSTSSDSVVGRLIGSYHINEDTNAYLSVSRGRRPEDLTFNVNAAPALGYTKTILPAETLMNYEAGIKGSADQGKFAYDVSAYYYKYTNFQSQVYQNAQYITVNSGRATAPGIETSLQEAFTPNLDVFLNATYEHARYGSPAAGTSAEDDFNGDHLRLAPDTTAALGMNWSIPLNNDYIGYVRPSYTWRSKTWFEDGGNTETFAQGAYGLLSLRIGVTFDQNHWDMGLFADNLTNKKYLVDAGNTGAEFDLPTYIPGPPRTFGVSVSGHF
jgi:iron complex outermembrane receptor protein